MTSIGSGGWRRVALAGAVALGAPLLVTSLAIYAPDVSTLAASMAYVVAVVTAAAVGGVVAGLVASVVSFFGLNYYFTDPRNSLALGDPLDFVASFVFVAVSTTVGSVLAAALQQRARAERRERQAELMHTLAVKFLAGEPPARVLRALADGLRELLDLAGCEVVANVLDEDVAVGSGEAASPGEVVELTAQDEKLGEIRVVGRRPLTFEDGRVVAAFADQMALTLDGLRLANQVKQAEFEAQTNKARAALFSSVTHDLRTPLASILGSATSLQDDAPGMTVEHRRELAETIRQEAERLNRLVGNLLQLSRMRAGVLTPNPIPAAIDEVVESVLARLQPVLGDHPVKVSVVGDLPEVMVDVVQIDQALTNLLENAASWAPPGTEIAIRAAASDGAVVVAISDRGPGVPESERERVFEPFVRGTGSTGTGLGLAIAKAVIEAHGGRIAIMEGEGGGATVVLELPVDKPAVVVEPEQQ